MNKLNAKVSHDPTSGLYVATYEECGSSHHCYGNTEQEALETLEDCVEIESQRLN